MKLALHLLNYEQQEKKLKSNFMGNTQLLGILLRRLLLFPRLLKLKTSWNKVRSGPIDKNPPAENQGSEGNTLERPSRC